MGLLDATVTPDAADASLPVAASNLNLASGVAQGFPLRVAKVALGLTYHSRKP